MKLLKGDRISGHPAKALRRFLQEAFRFGDQHLAEIVEELAVEHFGTDGEAVLSEFIRRGWLIIASHERKYPPTGHVPVYRLTKTGTQARAAKFTARFSRAVGEKLIAELVLRAEEINQRADLLCGVEELRLFGSLADPEAQDFGDLDVAFKLFRKETPPGKSWVDWNLERAAASGLQLNFIDKLYFAESEVRKLLKARHPRLSLQPWAYFELLKPTPPNKTIFSFGPGVRGEPY